MSEGRSPTATLTEQRRLEQEDVDILHQIVIRAQNEAHSLTSPRDALLQSYGEISSERNFSHHQDRACFNVLLKLLDPSTPGESLYHKFEAILRGEGIVLDYDDDTNASEQTREVDDGGRDLLSERAHSISVPSQQDVGHSEVVLEQPLEIRPSIQVAEDVYLNTPPAYIFPLMNFAKRKDERALIKQTLEAFERALENGRYHREEERANSFYEANLQRKTLKQCLAVLQDLRYSQNQADQIYRHKLTRDIITKTTDEYHVRCIVSIDQDRIKGLSLYKWVVATRESEFTRNREWRLQRKFLGTLITSYRTAQVRQNRLDDILQHSKSQDRNHLLRTALTLLMQENSNQREDESTADDKNRAVLCNAAINNWRTTTNKLTNLAVTGEDAREYFLMMRVFKRLRALTQYRRERKAWLATWTFRKWRDYVQNCKHERYDEAYRQTRRMLKVNLARRLLHHWQRKARTFTTQLSQADGIYQGSILQRFAKPVIELSWDTADWSNRSGVIADRKAEQFLQHRALIALQQRHQQVEDMNDRSDRLRQYRLEQRAVHGLRQMRLKGFELRRRQLDADAFLDRHNKRGVRDILSKMRRVLAEQQNGDEGPLILLPAPAVTPAKKKEELLFNSSTRLSTTPAYTPFSARLRAGPRILYDIEDMEELDTEYERNLPLEGDPGD